MAPGALKTKTFVKTILLIAATEVLAWTAAGYRVLEPLAILAAARLIQIGGIVLLLRHNEAGLDSIGWAPSTWKNGLFKGAVWSLSFAAAAAAAMAALYTWGRDPIAMLQFALPQRTSTLLLFFLVGGIIGPLAEELCFRGIVYTYFRQWGVMVAVAASTALFVGLHAVHGLPFIQIVGGVVFAIAYETSRNLMTPIVIHTTGNLALFGISLAGM